MDKNSTFADLIYLLKRLDQGIKSFLTEHEKEILQFNRKFKRVILSIGLFTGQYLEHTSKQKIINSNMSQEGWFPSSYTFRTAVIDGETNENFMRRAIKKYYAQIVGALSSQYPNRQAIFIEMFEDFDNKKYRNFIKEVFSQIDGICTDSGYAPFFSMEYDRNNPRKGNPIKDKKLKFTKFAIFLNEMIQTQRYDNEFLEYYKDAIGHASNSFIAESTHKLNYDDPNVLLNRHGIIHGDSAHLEACTELNALKILSLLLFVDFLIRGIEAYEIEAVENPT